MKTAMYITLIMAVTFLISCDEPIYNGEHVISKIHTYGNSYFCAYYTRKIFNGEDYFIDTCGAHKIGDTIKIVH